jgi:hypothetical protein
MTNIDKELINKLTTLVSDLLQAAQDNPNHARKYVRSREFAEKSMRCIGGGERRELVRPESIGLPVHELKAVEEPIRYPTPSDIIAHNLPDADEDKPKPIGRPKKVVE